MNCAKSLVFLLTSIFFTAAAVNASCPDPKDMVPQKGVDHPRWVTNDGWISDAEARVIEGHQPKLVQVYIVEPPPPPAVFPPELPKPIHAVLCSYSNGQNHTVIFNMREPFNSSSSRITRSNLFDWFNEMPTSQDYRMGYFCLYGLEMSDRKPAKCEFSFDGNVKTNDVNDYKDPFGGLN